jgi:hypothetical protein
MKAALPNEGYLIEEALNVEEYPGGCHAHRARNDGNSRGNKIHHEWPAEATHLLCCAACLEWRGSWDGQPDQQEARARTNLLPARPYYICK